MPRNDFEPPDLVNIVLAASLGLVALVIAIVAAVTGSAVLAIVIGAIALVLAGVTVWLSMARKRLNRALATAREDVARLESRLDEKSRDAVPAPSVETEPAEPRPTDARPTDARPTDATVAATEPSGENRLAAEMMSTPAPSDLSDPDTGLLGEQYFHITLDSRVAAARRHLRPLSLILIDAIRGLDGEMPHNAEPTVVADIIVHTLRDADIVCRLSDGRFALVLEDTPENGAIWTVERIRRRVNEALDDVTVWAGVACYPAHGFDGPEVLEQARKAVSAARDWRQDRTEVAES